MNLISRIYLYLFGTVTLKLEGEYCERLLNVLASHSISFWKPIKKHGNLYITVLRHDIKRIRPLRRNTGVRIKIVKKSGFPLIYNKYKHRYGLILGLIIFIVALNFLSSRMWMVKVNGNINVTKDQINAFFSSNGVKQGVSMNSVNSDILKQQLILSFKNIAWASVNKQGSVIEVNITEFTSKKEDEEPCNIVSGYDAVVKKIDVSKGSTAVKIGDTVSKNQILVSGIVNYGAGNSFVHPNGEIIAEVHLNKTVSINKVQETVVPTGKRRERKSLDIMGLKIPLYIGGVHGEHEVENSYENVKIFGGEIPIIIHKAKYSFVNKNYSKISLSEANLLADKSLAASLNAMGAQKVKYNLSKVFENEKEYVFEYTIVCNLDIGVEVPIEIKFN